MTAPSMISATTGPWLTSATRTATTPVTKAPTIGTNAPRKTRTAIGTASGTCRIAAETPMPMASTAATITVART